MDNDFYMGGRMTEQPHLLPGDRMLDPCSSQPVHISGEDRFWSSTWAYLLLMILIMIVIGECVWLLR